MTKIKLTVALAISCIVILAVLIVFTAIDQDKSHFIIEQDNNLTTVSEDAIVVASNELTITLGEYIDYRENVRMIHALNNIPFTLTAEELVDNLINHRLFLHYAKGLEIDVTDEEVLEYAVQTKEAFFENRTPEFDEILKRLVNTLGVRKEEDYFTHPKTLENYRNLLLTQKAVEQLYEEGRLINRSGSVLDEFIEELREERDPGIRINLKEIKKSDRILLELSNK